MQSLQLKREEENEIPLLLLNVNKMICKDETRHKFHSPVYRFVI